MPTRRILLIGARGTLGQEAIARLERRPDFELHLGTTTPLDRTEGVPADRTHLLRHPYDEGFVLHLLWRCVGLQVQTVIPLGASERRRIEASRSTFARAGVEVFVPPGMRAPSRWPASEAHTS